MKISEFMTTKIEYIDADDTVYDALEKMVDLRIRSLVVKLPGNYLSQGVITARDVVFKVLARGLNPNETKVSAIASKPIICVDRNLDMTEVSALMKKTHIARVFVCDNEKLVGVVSLLDAMSASLIMRARGEHVS